MRLWSLLQKQRHHLIVIRLVVINWAIIFIGLFVNSGLNAITLILIARRIDAFAYGQYLASYALVSLLVMLPGFGTDAWLLTQYRSSKEEAYGLWLSLLRLRLVLLVIWGLGMVLVTIFLPASTYPLKILIPSIIGSIFDSITILGYTALRIRERHLWVTFLQSITAILLLSLIFLIPLTENFVGTFAVCRAILSFVTVTIVLSMLWEKSNNLVRDSLVPMRHILSAARTFMQSEVAATIYARADVTIISLTLGAVATGIYGPAINILQAVAIFPRALFFFIVPVLSKTYLESRSSFLKQGYTQLLFQVLVGTFVSIAVFLFAPQIIRLIFLDEYDPSITILKLFSPVPFLRSINFGLAALLASSNCQPQRTQVQFASAGFNVIANMFIIGIYGLRGVAVVYVLSELLLLLGYMTIVFRLAQNISLQLNTDS